MRAGTTSETHKLIHDDRDLECVFFQVKCHSADFSTRVLLQLSQQRHVALVKHRGAGAGTGGMKRPDLPRRITGPYVREPGGFIGDRHQVEGLPTGKPTQQPIFSLLSISWCRALAAALDELEGVDNGRQLLQARLCRPAGIAVGGIDE